MVGCVDEMSNSGYLLDDKTMNLTDLTLLPELAAEDQTGPLKLEAKLRDGSIASSHSLLATSCCTVFAVCCKEQIGLQSYLSTYHLRRYNSVPRYLMVST